jgi:hypothetical protein
MSARSVQSAELDRVHYGAIADRIFELAVSALGAAEDGGRGLQFLGSETALDETGSLLLDMRLLGQPSTSSSLRRAAIILTIASRAVALNRPPLLRLRAAP